MKYNNKLGELAMRCKKHCYILFVVFSFLIINGVLLGQEALSTSQVWFGNALRAWFPEKIEIHGSSYYTTRIRCSNKDLTHFKAQAGKTDVGLGPAFRIEGSLTIDPLLPGLKVVNGAKGKKYMLLLQGYLFSQQGKLLWSQKGFPKGESWVPHSGSIMRFKLIDKFSGLLKGCTAVVIAIGDPIFIEGTSETRVILGMKRYSFKDENETTIYDPTISKPIQSSKIQQRSTKQKKKYANLKYVQKKFNIFKYEEVVSIPVHERKKIFYELIEYQDRTGDDESAHKVIAKRYGLPERAVSAISGEGAVKSWPMPDLP